MELGLQGRRVLVTGGSQGIGFAIAEGFLREGSSVTIVSRDTERLRDALARPSKIGDAAGRSLDLSERGSARPSPTLFPRRMCL